MKKDVLRQICEKRMVLLLTFLFFSYMNSFSQIWVNTLTSGRPISTVYLGDRLTTTWYFNYEIGQSTWNASEVGIGQNSDGSTGWNWGGAFWYQDNGTNRYVRRDIGNFQFTNIGTWYVVGRAKAFSGDAWTYADEGGWTNNTVLIASTSSGNCPYFSANSLNNPTATTPFTVTSSSAALVWSKDAQNHNVMIVRKKTTDSWTEPTQGTAYVVDATLGNGVVVYNSSGTSFNNTGLSSSTGYDYKFYSENNSYYSAGVVASATTETASTDYFQSKSTGNWGDASSWQSSSDNVNWVTTATLAPNSSANTVSILNGHTISVNGTETANGLTVNSGGVLQILSTKSLTVTGTLTNNATETGLVVQSGGSLIQNSAVSATVEREITGWSDAAHGWHFLSSPVTSQAISSGFTATPATNYDFYAWWEPTNEWVNYKNTTVAPTWATANVLGGTSGGDNFIPGKGYLVSYATAAAGTKQFKGTLNTANVSVSNLAISAGTNKGFYLLGNPFTSALTWATGWSLTHINSTAKVWKESTAAYVDVASGGIIPSLNGFMVEVIEGFGGSNSLTIPTSARVHNNAIAWYKSSENSSIVLVANDPAGQTEQESKIRIVPEATGGFDNEFDSHFYPGFAPKFYSTIGSEQLSTNTLPDLPAESMIPFGFVKNDASNFSIELKESMEGYEVFLKDLKTNTDQNLTENPVYTFTSEANDDANRFMLHFLSTVGTTEPSCPAALRIYANAGNIYLSGATGNADVFVRNMLGQTVMQRSVSGDALKVINAGNLTSGVYIVSVVNSGQTISGKVIIK